MSVDQLGAPLIAQYAVPGGEARVYERVATINGAGGEVVVHFNFPMIGVPHIAVGDAATASVFEPTAITVQPSPEWPMDALVPLIHTALAERLAMLPTAQPPQPVPLVFGAAEMVVPPGAGIPPTYGIPTSAAVQERQLYDVAVLTDTRQ